jgi:hypothetical protein
MTLQLFQLIWILHCFECLKIVFNWFYLIMIKTKDLLICLKVFYWNGAQGNDSHIFW